MQESWSYMKDSAHCMNKICQIGENVILVTADVVGLYPSIPHKARLKTLKNALEKRDQNNIPTKKLISVAKFVLKNNFFQFNGFVKQQVSETVIGTKSASSYTCICMDEVDPEFLRTQERTLLV